jgi:hypothetical protein
MQRIQELNADFSVKFDEVNAALEEKKYSIAAEKAKALKEIEGKIRDEITTSLKEAKEENKKIQEQQKIKNRDTAVVNLMNSGTTDPLDIYTKMALDGTLGDTTLGEIIAIAGAVDNIAYLKEEKKKKAGKTSSTDLAQDSYTPDGGVDVSEGFDFNKATYPKLKNFVRELFPGSFGDKLVAELTDEMLKEYVADYVKDSNQGQNSPDPEVHFLEWAKERGVGEEEDSTGLSDAELDAFLK